MKVIKTSLLLYIEFDIPKSINLEKLKKEIPHIFSLHYSGKPDPVGNRFCHAISIQKIYNKPDPANDEKFILVETNKDIHEYNFINFIHAKIRNHKP